MLANMVAPLFLGSHHMFVKVWEAVLKSYPMAGHHRKICTEAGAPSAPRIWRPAGHIFSHALDIGIEHSPNLPSSKISRIISV